MSTRKQKTERNSAGDFLFVFIPCLKYLTLMITKRSKAYAPYLYVRIKVQKSIPIYVKSKKGVGAYILISKRTLHFNVSKG